MHIHQKGRFHWQAAVLTMGKGGCPRSCLFPGNQVENNTPYYEAGVGVENIFKFIRVDAIWRLSHHDPNHPRNFGVFISAALSF